MSSGRPMPLSDNVGRYIVCQPMPLFMIFLLCITLAFPYTCEIARKADSSIVPRICKGRIAFMSPDTGNAMLGFTLHCSTLSSPRVGQGFTKTRKSNYIGIEMFISSRAFLISLRKLFSLYLRDRTKGELFYRPVNRQRANCNRTRGMLC